MFLGTFLSGYVPIFFASLGGCSAKRLRFISAVGVGVLIGTALSIIIPEGVHKLYQASIIRHSVLSSDMHDNSEDILNSSPCHFDEDNLKYIGMALSGGFVFMLLIEFITTGLVGHGHSHSTHSTTSNNYEENGLSLGEKEKLSQSNFRTKGRICCRCSSSSTIGLLIHCAIDGIAMGSVGSSQSGAQEFMVFLALFLHKAPSAFGLSSLLLQQRSHLKDGKC